MKRTLTFLGLALALVACAPVDGAETTEQSAEELQLDRLPSRARSHFSLGESEARRRNLLDEVFTVEHDVRVGPSRRMHVTESLTLRSLFRFPRRAVVMLPGPVTQGSGFNVDVDGYRGRDMLARRGFFAFSVDFEGTGRSTKPTNGATISQQSQVEAVQQVVRYVREQRFVLRVDMLGESWGGGVAAEVCADRVRVRSCVLASMLYRTPSAFFSATFLDPGFIAFLNSQPNGYLTTVPMQYGVILATAPADVQTAFLATQVGSYAISPVLDATSLPFFNPTIGRAPAVIIQGEFDPNQPISDAHDLAANYGGPARVVVVPGGPHVPRLGSPANAAFYWSTVYAHLD